MKFMSILTQFGFEAQRDGSMRWASGSLMWGDAIQVWTVKDGYKVEIAKWEYGCDGDAIIDECETRTLDAAHALQWMAEKFPIGLWKAMVQG